MTVELGVSPRALFDLFDAKVVSPGMSREVPGGFAIRLGEMSMEKRDLPSVQATAFVPILVTIGTAVITPVALNMFASFLYEKVKGGAKVRRMITINRKLIEVTTPEAITKVLEETIKIEERE